MAEPTPFIRPYDPKDEEAMIHVFRETASPDLVAGGSTVLHLASYNWCRPYFLLQPQNCFVLDDGNGTAVGYVIGVPDTEAFVKQYRETYIPYLESEGVHKPGPEECTDWNDNLPNALRSIAYNPESMLHRDWPSLVKEYPGHLHIDILKSHQRAGFGRKMIDRFCAQVAQQGAVGVHLGMVVTNEDAGRFYERIGFGRYPYMIDGGKSGEIGRKGHAVIRVRKLG